MGEAKRRLESGAAAPVPTPRLTQYTIFLDRERRAAFEVEFAAFNTERVAKAQGPPISRSEFIAAALYSMISGLKTARDAEAAERDRTSRLVLTPAEAAIEAGS